MFCGETPQRSRGTRRRNERRIAARAALPLYRNQDNVAGR